MCLLDSVDPLLRSLDSFYIDLVSVSLILCINLAI